MQKRRALAVTVVAGLVSTVLAACGGGADEGAETFGLTGEPIVLEVITMLTSVTPSPQTFHGALAAAAAVNESGGINGRPLEVRVCDAGTTDGPAKSVECARNMVADPDVIAEVGDYQAYQDQANTVLAEGGVPNIGPPPQSQSVLNSPNSFPLAGQEGAGGGVVLADAGATRIQVAYTNVAQAAAAEQFNRLTLQLARGIDLVGGIPIDITATDVTPAVTRAAEGDGVILAMLPSQLASWLTVADSGNFPQQIAVSSSSLNPTTLAAVAAQAEGVLVSSALPLVSSDQEGVVQFRDEMAQHQPDSVVDQISLNGWLGTWAFAQVAREIDGDVTRESVTSAFGNLTDFNVFGLLPEGFSTTEPFTTVPGFTRLFNQGVVTGIVHDGVIEQTSPGFVPVFSRP